MKAAFLLFCLVLAACASQPLAPLVDSYTSSPCQSIYRQARAESPEKQLDAVTDLYNSLCYSEVISLGGFLRTQSREKFYQISAELAEIVTPEGTFTQYVLESYERAYLSLLISMSYLNLNKESDALVELRRSQDEVQAFIYNYGSDPVLTLLQGALWDRFDPGTARPYWKETFENKKLDPEIRKMAKIRLQEIDRGPSKKTFWKIYGIGYLPTLDWQSGLIHSGSGLYKIFPQEKFPNSCATDESILISTSSWVDKISIKYNRGYHPLLFAKSLARFPVGVGYGVLGVTGGIAVGASGCIVAGAAHDSQDSLGLCSASLHAGGYLIKKTSNLVEYTLKPDLRHWEKVPMAFYLLRDPISPEVYGKPQGAQCLPREDLMSMRTVFISE